MNVVESACRRTVLMQGVGIVLLLIVEITFGASVVKAGTDRYLDTISAEVMLRVESDLFLQHYLYGGSKQVVFSPGVIEPDTVVVFWWDDPINELEVVRSAHLALPTESAASLGRYLPSAISIFDSLIAVAISTTVFVYDVENKGELIHTIDLPVVATSLDIRDDTLHFASDQWNTDHAPLSSARRRAFYGYCPIDQNDEGVEYQSVDEPLGLAMNLFQPRAFLEVRGGLTAFVKGLVDSLVLLHSGNVVASADLATLCDDHIETLMKDFENDSTWTYDPHAAMDKIRSFYKSSDLVRSAYLDSDTSVVLRIDLGDKYLEGLLSGRNISRIYRWVVSDDSLALERQFLSRSPSLKDSPFASAPFSQHMWMIGGEAIAFESLSTSMLGKRSWEELIEENERSTRLGVHQVSVTRRK